MCLKENNCSFQKRRKITNPLMSLFRYLEIAVKQCRNGGIDCKIHGLQVVGKKRSEEDSFSSNLSFLTSDSEEFDDQVRSYQTWKNSKIIPN
jgi:E3 ubiquitin-protein ligase HERC2